MSSEVISSSNKIIHTHYTDDGLNLDFYENFISGDDAEAMMKYLEKTVTWAKPPSDYRRNNATFGDDGLVYIVKVKDKEIRRPAMKWDPIILSIRERLMNLTKKYFNFGMLLRYPSGKVGITPHRDKEMVEGTTIAGISFGEIRYLNVERSQYNHINGTKKKKYVLKLTPGSLYCFNPPTNSYWLHSIDKDDTLGPRISLTFRTYDPSPFDMGIMIPRLLNLNLNTDSPSMPVQSENEEKKCKVNFVIVNPGE